MKKYLFLVAISLIYGCGFYSFSGASISSDVKTISVQYFPNKATTIQSNLSQTLTEKLKDYFLQQTNLQLVTNEGDLQFSGEIVSYEVKPMSIQANEQAAQNRLTIAVKVKFENTKQEKNNFDQRFSRFADFDSNQNLMDVEEVLIEQITNEIVEDIFNKAVVNW